jgi:hypothetical protein
MFFFKGLTPMLALASLPVAVFVSVSRDRFWNANVG